MRTKEGVDFLTLKIAEHYADEHASAVKAKSAELTLGTSWTGSDPYTQIVTLSGLDITGTTRVDACADGDTIAALKSYGVRQLYISNDGGTLTAVAIGGRPTAAVTIQVYVTDVIA